MPVQVSPIPDPGAPPAITTTDFMSTSSPNQSAPPRAKGKILTEALGLIRGPQRAFPLFLKLASDKVRVSVEQRNLYSYATASLPTDEALRHVVGWILRAQRSDGGVPAYYSLLTGYSNSYPEVTGYIVPTLYDFARQCGDNDAVHAADRATGWLLSLQMPTGAFPGGLEGENRDPSIFNTGQILQGLIRTHVETGRLDALKAANAAGDWLASVQQSDGSWSGPAAYQGTAHTYYSMVAWALAQLAELSGSDAHANAAERNLDWVLGQIRPNGWTGGINLQGYPTYLHFIAYVIQGVLECGILRGRADAIDAASRSAWTLLRKFELRKHLLGAYTADFESGLRFTCLTGNAQMSCVWLRLFELSRDLRYLNAALKMNEMIKALLPSRGRPVIGGVAGSFPAWGSYQPLRYISWGCKFFADALMLELRMKRNVEAAPCAS
jgi:Squalene-hopene cyclase C-terminal domain